MSFHMDPRQFEAYQAALGDVGLREIPGPKHNPAILEMFEKVGASWFKADEVAWCGAYLGALLVDVGLPILPGGRSVTARSWHLESWGVAVPIEKAPKGALIVLRRGDYVGRSGHVALLHRLVRNDNGEVVGFFLVGGNQSNSVSIQYYDRFDAQGRDLLLSARVYASSAKVVRTPQVDGAVQNTGILVAIGLAFLALIFGR